MKIKLGLEVFYEREFKKYRNDKIGILCNQASTDQKLRHISDLLLEKKLALNVTCFFGPQHGIRGEKQDNMIESQDFIDSRTGLPVYSLYGMFRYPTEESFRTLDTLIVDLQDVGCRVYTFIYTLANCMRAAAQWGKKIVVLDRPNPVGGLQREGFFLKEKFQSFVGQYPIPFRHGLTIGELAKLFNEHFEIGCDLQVVKMKGWKRSNYYDIPTLHWMPPSPNIPSFSSALTFLGTVFLEGTNVSEGRGTTRPFEFIGAPYIDGDKLAHQMNALKLKGIQFRPIYFQPTFNKGMGKLCGGVHLYVNNPSQWNGFRTGLFLMKTIRELYPKDFQWKQPPYEYEYEKMPIDLIVGDDSLREAIDHKKPLRKIFEREEKDIKEFKRITKKFELYA